ncbi:hypothetical protein ACFLT7_06215 [candidate division KSB1 bacterium]
MRTHKSGRQARTFFAVFLTALLVATAACERWIVDPGPQPSYIEQRDHEPLLNVFGLLRPDSLEGNPLSFVHLEGSFAATDSFPDSLDIWDAEVVLFRYDGAAVADSLRLTHTDFGVAIADSQYRHPDLYPTALTTWGLACRKEGFPTLTATTTVPAAPVIVDGSLTLTGNRLELAIQRDNSAAAYDIELWIGPDKFSERVRRPESGNTAVRIDFNAADQTEATLVIYAYDANLSEYISANIGAKPNTYQPSFSTVDNGLGCFGSLGLYEKSLALP